VNLSVKKFENRSTFGKVMDNIVVPCFFDSQCIYIFGGSCPLTKFCQVQCSLCGQVFAFSYIGSVTARHSSSGRQPDCGVQQGAPLIFIRAAITLGIGLHFSHVFYSPHVLYVFNVFKKIFTTISFQNVGKYGIHIL